MLFRYAWRVVLPMVVLALNVACSPDDDAAPLEYRADIVTFTGNGESGANFDRVEQNGDRVTQLLADGVRVDTTRVAAGSRVLMVYEEKAAGEPQCVNIRSLQQIVTGSVRVTDDMDGWNRDAVYMISMWRTGGYLNMECRVENSEAKRSFCLVADPATMNNAVPDLYVMHDMGEHAASYMRRVYASWDISDVWRRTGCRGVRVHINDSNRGISEMTFTKD